MATRKAKAGIEQVEPAKTVEAVTGWNKHGSPKGKRKATRTQDGKPIPLDVLTLRCTKDGMTRDFLDDGIEYVAGVPKLRPLRRRIIAKITARDDDGINLWTLDAPDPRGSIEGPEGMRFDIKVADDAVKAARAKYLKERKEREDLMALYTSREMQRINEQKAAGKDAKPSIPGVA
jgi:hypothetical protein